VQTKQSN